MSVLVPDHKVFSYIHSGMRTAEARNTCDAKYSYIIKSYFGNKDFEKESKRLVRNWLNMIERSYNAAYKETGVTGNLLRLEWVDFTPIQLLKFLECVEYNIETPGIQTPQDKKDFDLLKAWRGDLSTAIIHALPEYETAKWSEI